MPFDLTIHTRYDGQFNWFDLPDSDRPAMNELREKFNLVQFRTGENLVIEGTKTVFSKPWSEIVAIKIGS